MANRRAGIIAVHSVGRIEIDNHVVFVHFRPNEFPLFPHGELAACRLIHRESHLDEFPEGVRIGQLANAMR